MSDNDRIYITLEPTPKDSGFTAIAMPIIAVLCLVGAVSVLELVIPALILIIAAVVFACIGLKLCSRVRKYGATMPYARTLATLGYIVCLLILIAAVLTGGCAVGIGGCIVSVLGGVGTPVI